MAEFRKAAAGGVGEGRVISEESTKIACTFQSRSFDKVRRIAEKNGASVASVVRVLVDEALEARASAPAPPARTRRKVV